ncbi:MAG: ADP-glyceromanno-heptose 6-epimerase [Lentimicrobium sp.]|jgi:ADP-L-glycero-D-manno-heptose 6-epimerase|nr:ADP-glyceromanno-heptose 6-epimerase [Lentimicrobium sp.]MDD2526458.1 ADP-glyceromanno-heptose 6-epimerase [Lentimicrobiaceae bacterium]MDD4596407.1 ADP-glyceromanno-heptose 6-epimerase [Lentimicrobiaceae bacterium]MDY0026508.1 ADP-glyceromanno-heptose 6-epimerase [Lentimicrobium sp.]HAH56803.1 ADP-glyceromanno-heptose 6-epimerase [Bacteroidales bacterium]
MIVVTGAAGFIGSVLVSTLIDKGFNHIVAVDDFSKQEKRGNYADKDIRIFVERNVFFNWFKENHENVDFVFHLGARTDTTEFNKDIFDELNVNYSKQVWQLCSTHKIPLVYASSAATYGMGEHGYVDDHRIVDELEPLNPYGRSKNDFDRWALVQSATPPFWAGMKFFNVYGPNEYHKGRMASVIFHAYGQMTNKGEVKLFRSHRPDFEDGMQLRDFIYVKDVVDVLIFMMEKRPESGLYNLGTGKARSFLHLTKATFAAAGLPEKIVFVDTPEDIRDKYQYFTEANMEKLRKAGYLKAFASLEDGVSDYVNNYLKNHNYL